jgi:hypothetical protein
MSVGKNIGNKYNDFFKSYVLNYKTDWCTVKLSKETVRRYNIEDSTDKALHIKNIQDEIDFCIVSCLDMIQ